MPSSYYMCIVSESIKAPIDNYTLVSSIIEVDVGDDIVLPFVSENIEVNVDDGINVNVDDVLALPLVIEIIPVDVGDVHALPPNSEVIEVTLDHVINVNVDDVLALLTGTLLPSIYPSARSSGLVWRMLTNFHHQRGHQC
eukprot:4283298-Amphidinium_carterae.1